MQIMSCLQFPRIQALACSYLFCLLIILQSTQRTAADYEFDWIDCQGDSNYTANSTYQSNLNLLLSSLSTAAVATGYDNDTAGTGSNQVYGLAQCRGDQSSTDCQSCLSTAAQSIVQKCPKAQNSAIFYEECFLRYSNQSFFSSTSTPGRNYYIYLCNADNASDPQTFDDLLGSMMDDLSTRASNSPKKYAGGVANYTSFTKLYGLAQCTRDLSQPDCDRCIQDLRTNIPNYCGRRKGGRIFAFTCYVRYELYQFYNISADGALPTPPSAPSLPPSSSTTNGTGDPQGTTGGKKSNNTGKVLAIAIAIPIAVALAVLLLVLLFLRKRKTKSSGGQGGDKTPDFSSTEYILFNFATLRSATNNFVDSNKLGQGGFGPVYKGTLENGEQIAVKRLSINSGQGLVEFKTEIVLVAKLQHKNLVRLLGCCFQEQEKILVYEYLPNKSLDTILFNRSRKLELNWGRRRKIIEGVARGLLYLHEDSRLKIIHRDLKASNILLDGDMNPKISDFGLAKLVNIDQTQINTSKIAGTYGYMAPEYAMHGIFSVKSDVFSYGVLVLEIVTGRRNNGSDEHYTNLLTDVWRHWNEGRAVEMVDKSMVDQLRADEAIRYIHIGLLCVQEDAADRPNMASVVLMLSSHSVNLPNPYAPAFVFHSRSTYDSDSQDVSDAQGRSKKNSRGSTATSLEISEDDPIILSA